MTTVFLALAGCGGSPASIKPNAQNSVSAATSPQANAAQPSAGTGTASAPASSPTSAPASASTTAAAGPTASAPANTPPPTYAQIQAMSGWQWCTATQNGSTCASGLGNATSSMTEKQAQPSLSGASAVFTLGGNTPYSNALWWKSLASDTTSTHFTYDLYFLMDNPGAPQALEFDVNQAIGNDRYVWGSECNYHGTGKWDIWNDQTGHWEPTAVACPEVSANQWHHLVWQLERKGNQVHYISVSVDGKTSGVDIYRNFQANAGKGGDINVAFQLDGDFQQSPYKVWLDKVSLTAW